MSIRVLLSGAAGRMGRAMGEGVLNSADMQIVAAVDTQCVGLDVGDLIGSGPIGVPVSDDLAAAIESSSPDVMLDFTNPQAVMGNIRTALTRRLSCVVGTTGLGEAELAEAESLALAHGAALFIAPNFALSAVLMMRFAAEAVKYFPDYEIIEIHHQGKVDAPSGTALFTAKLMSESRDPHMQGALNAYEVLPGSRGGDFQGARVHSVRLPGVVAAQEVLFGGPGQTLSIRQDSSSRDSFFPGVALALRKIKDLHGLTVGLDKLL